MKKLSLLFVVLCTATAMFAQTTVTGVVTDDSGETVIGANVIEDGTANGAVTDIDGKFTIDVSSPNATLIISFIGYVTQEVQLNGQTNIAVELVEGIQLGSIQIVGSRSYKRTATTTPVAVDIIDVQDIAARNGNAELNKILQYLAPSFNAQKQSGSDGAEHIDPASLRGLGPDQTLVLINGKRRHQSSLINIFGTRGRGNTGTDLNAIPASAIERIEILRDGAAAQYGSDAIAGVINIVLRKDTNKLTGAVTVGGFNPIAPDEFGIYERQ